MPRHARVEGLPANESVQHFILKWAAHHVLTREMECPYVVVEAGAGTAAGPARRSGRSRHDAVGLRFRAGRSPAPWVELPTDAVAAEVLDEASGRWVGVHPAGLDSHVGDPTLRAFERADGSLVPLRAVAPGGPGTVRVRRSGGRRRELAQLCGADAKQSPGDLRAWIREAPLRLRGLQYFFIVAPEGLAPVDELPPKVGLAEVALDRLVSDGGGPSVTVRRWPEALRPGAAWDEPRTEAFARRAYHSMNGLFARQLFWFLAQEALDRHAAAGERRSAGAAAAGTAGTLEPSTASGARAHGSGDRSGRADPALAAVDADAAAGARVGRVAREVSAHAAPGGAAALTSAAPQPAPTAGGPVRIRTYEPSDRAAVIDLWVRTGIARPWLDLGGELDAWRDPRLMLVAELAGRGRHTQAQVVGAVLGGWDGRRGWVHHLAVDSDHRRRGVATALLHEVERRLKEAGAPKVNLLIRPDNLAVTALYVGLGYEIQELRFMSKWLVAPPVPEP